MSFYSQEHVELSGDQVNRRGLLQRLALSGLAAGGAAAFSDVMSAQANELREQGKSMILLFMRGGPSQFESFDPKPGTTTGGETKAIKTAVPGIEIAEGWENTAKVMKDIAIIRSMNNREGNHQRATYELHTGYVPSGSVKHPSLAANLAMQLADPKQDLPSVVGIGRSQGAGFLGVNFEPFTVRSPGRMPDNLATTVRKSRYQRRLGLLDELEADFAERGGRVVVENHRKTYDKATKMVLSKHTKAFDISREPRSLRSKYGSSNFGRGCLLARRLVESGVTFVEVSSGGWDTHSDNFNRSKRLVGQVDPAFAALVADLKERGRLDKTLVVWMGEFGRTPRVNSRTGRDHFPRAFSVAVAGGGVKGGQVIGATNSSGSYITKDRVSVPDLFCSICHSMGVNPRTENISPLGRPMKIVDGGKVVKALF